MPRPRTLSVLTLLLALGCLAAMATAPSRGSAQTGFVVIVNAGNSTSSVSKNDLAKMFMRKLTRWPNGDAVQPVDQNPGATVRDAFSKAVHGRSASAIVSHWRQQIFSGRAVPPPERKGDSAVVSFVNGNRGAVGYVSRGAPLGNAKPLTVSGL